MENKHIYYPACERFCIFLLSIYLSIYMHMRSCTDICDIGQFSEAGLHEWMPSVIFHARSCERSQCHFRADFWVALLHAVCIKMEVEPRIVKQYKCHHCCSCKNYQGKGIEGGKKGSLRHFLADHKITSSWKKCVLGHPIAQATSYCLLPDTFWLRASKNAFKFTNSLSPPSIVKKVLTRSKSSQGTWAMPGKSQGS